jgi:hypothetical protein
MMAVRRELTEVEWDILSAMENYPWAGIAVPELKEEIPWEMDGRTLHAILVRLERMGLVKRRPGRVVPKPVWYLPGEEPANLRGEYVTKDSQNQIRRRIDALKPR